mgnify:CR=1 FL=1
MPIIMLRRLAASLALLAIAPVPAEAQTRGYPSLAKRPVESRDRTVPAAQPVQPAAPDAALATQVETLGKQAASGDAAFQQQIAQGRKTASAATGAAPASESWVAAEMTISALDSARYESVAALAGLDTLYVDKQDNADAARVTTDLATIDPVRTRVLALVDAQNDALDSLRKSLRQP